MLKLFLPAYPVGARHVGKANTVAPSLASQSGRGGRGGDSACTHYTHLPGQNEMRVVVGTMRRV